MSEGDEDKIDSAAQGSAQTPTIPVSGANGKVENKAEVDKKDEFKGVVWWLKRTTLVGGIAVACMTVVGTGVGIVVAIHGILGTERAYQQKQVDDNRKYELEMEKLKEAAQHQQLQQLKDGAQLELERKIAELASDQAKKETIEIAAQKSRTDLQKLQEEIAREQRKDQAEQLKQLEVDVTKLRTAKSPEDAFAATAAIAAYLTGDGVAKRWAIESLESRLQAFPPRAEAAVILKALPDAGPEGLEVAVRANRLAWKALAIAIRRERVSLIRDKRDLDTLAVVLEKLAPLERESRRDKVEHDIVEATDRALRDDPAADFDRFSGAPELEAVVAVLAGSREALERLLPKQSSGSVIHLERCFLPHFSPDRATVARLIDLRNSYVAGSDFRALETQPTLRLFFSRKVSKEDAGNFAMDGIPDLPDDSSITKDKWKSQMQLKMLSRESLMFE